VPAAAVIPAPIAYIKVVAVKTLVVEPWTPAERGAHWAFLPVRLRLFFSWGTGVRFTAVRRESRTVTLKKLECSKQAVFTA
jgi:hypothetical protein